LSRKKHAEKIKRDVIDWSKYVLEPMNKHLGFPACPFAAKWRKDGKLRIEVRPDKSKYEKHLTNLLKDWNKKQHDILIFCDPYFDQYDELQFQEKIDFYNKTYNRRDVYFMGFHPNNPATVEEQEFLVNPTDDNSQYESDLGYSMMLIQKFKQLYDASCKLHKIGYYKKWPPEYYDEVVKVRQEAYEKLFKKEKTS
jgi:glycerophosphoryl diester phosphodiesterase